MEEKTYFTVGVVLDPETQAILEQVQRELGLERQGRSRALNIIIKDWQRARIAEGKFRLAPLAESPA